MAASVLWMIGKRSANTIAEPQVFGAPSGRIRRPDGNRVGTVSQAVKSSFVMLTNAKRISRDCDYRSMANSSAVKAFSAADE